MAHDDPVAFVPFRFDDALERGAIDVLQYALGVRLARRCYEARNVSEGVAAVRLQAIADLFQVSTETIRRKLHDLQRGGWIGCEVEPGQPAWRIWLTGLASPPAPQTLHRRSTPEGSPVWSVTSTGEQPRDGANPHGESDSGSSKAPQNGSKPEDTTPHHTKALLEERLDLDRTSLRREGSETLNEHEHDPDSVDELAAIKRPSGGDETRAKTRSPICLVCGKAAKPHERNLDGSYLHDECARSTATR